MDAELFGPKKTTPRTTPRKSTPTSAKKPPVADSKGNEGKDDWLFGDSVSTSVKPKDQSLLSSAIASDDFHIDSPGIDLIGQFQLNLSSRDTSSSQLVSIHARGRYEAIVRKHPLIRVSLEDRFYCACR